MKSAFSLFLVLNFLLFALSSIAQPPSTTIPETKYGEGGTLTTRTDISSDGTVTVTEEYRNSFPKLKERTRRIKNRTGQDSIVITIIYDEFGQGELKDSTIEKRYNRNGDMIYLEAIRHDAAGTGINSGTRSEKQPDGDWTEYEYNPRSKEFEKVRPTRPKKIKENGVTGYLASCDTASWEFITSLSLLSINPNDLYSGIQAGIAYHVTPRLGLMIDASFHEKKIYGVKYTKSFLTGGLQYHILKTQGLKKMVPMARFLAGLYLINQKLYPSSGNSAFTIGAGTNLNLFLSRAVYFSFLTDIFLTSIDKGLHMHPRISAGIRIRTGCQ